MVKFCVNRIKNFINKKNSAYSGVFYFKESDFS